MIGPQQLEAPLLRRGDVVRFAPRRNARRWRYVEVSSDIQYRARHCDHCPEWVTFSGYRLRSYDWGTRISAEGVYGVRISELHRMPRPPARFTTPDGRIVVDVISLE